MHVNLLSLPISRNHELATVRTRVVVLLLDEGRIVLELGVPCVAHILVDTVAVAVQLEKSRDGEVHPVGIVVAHRLESDGSLVVILDKIEFPVAFEAHEPGALLLDSTLGQGIALVGEEATAHLLCVHTVRVGIQPTLCFFWGCRSRQDGHRCQREKYFFQHKKKCV